MWFGFQGCPSLPWVSDHRRLKDPSLSLVNPALESSCWVLPETGWTLAPVQDGNSCVCGAEMVIQQKFVSYVSTMIGSTSGLLLASKRTSGYSPSPEFGPQRKN